MIMWGLDSHFMSIGQIIMVREEGDPAPEGIECKHGLTPPMRDMLGSEGSTENLI